ncbi:MAG: hypothetical protein JO130_14430 [Solirubrobacterales bacterium]|nr:hypothetical protein [Solirubrobacterales bacterium]
MAHSTAIFMVVYLATAVAVPRDHPSRTIFMSALVTAGGALGMLPFTGLAFPLADGHSCSDRTASRTSPKPPCRYAEVITPGELREGDLALLA